jgi:nitrate reductase assembly molybdenum cofactor insertion protein NarJ
MVQDAVNTWATLRFALSYPDERHLERFRELFDDSPETLEELRALYIDLFEAGLPHPKCPLIEGYYLLNRPAGEVVLENKLYYKHFGLETPAQASPDHLLTQLEFLCWLDYCIDSGNPDRESLVRARSEFVERHLAHWVAGAAASLKKQSVRCYAPVFALLADQVQNLKEIA